MFTYRPDILKQDRSHDIYSLKSTNYHKLGKGSLFEKQLVNAKKYIQNQENANKICFTHVYANGYVDNGGDSSYRVIPFSGPFFSVTFNHSQLPLEFTICEVTDLVVPEDDLLLTLLAKEKIYKSFSLVISATSKTDLKSLLDRLEKFYDIEKLPPVIVVVDNQFSSNINDIINQCKIGILTVIRSHKKDGVHPIRLYHKSFKGSCDKLSDTWDQLTAVLNIFYGRASPEMKPHFKIKA